MTNNIGAISGGGSSWGIDWSNNSSNKQNVEDNQAKEQNANAQPERKNVNPDDVMRFLASQSFLPVNVEAKSAVEVGAVDAETQNRVAGYMERFEELYAIIEAEFGSELASDVFDVAMDKLLGMA